jgi:hypothetical protein
MRQFSGPPSLRRKPDTRIDSFCYGSHARRRWPLRLALRVRKHSSLMLFALAGVRQVSAPSWFQILHPLGEERFGGEQKTNILGCFTTTRRLGLRIRLRRIDACIPCIGQAGGERSNRARSLHSFGDATGAGLYSCNGHPSITNLI